MKVGSFVDLPSTENLNNGLKRSLLCAEMYFSAASLSIQQRRGETGADCDLFFQKLCLFDYEKDILPPVYQHVGNVQKKKLLKVTWGTKPSLAMPNLLITDETSPTGPYSEKKVPKWSKRMSMVCAA